MKSQRYKKKGVKWIYVERGTCEERKGEVLRKQMKKE